MNDFGLGILLARERLRGFGAWLVLLLSCASVYAVGVLEQHHAGSRELAADTVLMGAVFGVALPILSYLVCERVCDGQRLSRSVDVLARHGGDRRALVLGLLLGSALGMSLIGALLTAVALLGAHGPSASGPAFARDLRVSMGVALLSGAVYVLWFGFASQFGKRGGGRKWALLVDFVLGAGGSRLAVPWPRGHVRNLLGGAPIHEFSQGSAWLALAVIAVISLTLSVLPTPD